LRARVAQAWRLARGIHNVEASQKLVAYAEELEGDLQKLEAQAAVMKRAASESAQKPEPEGSIAALKPATDREPGT
jgi:peptidoglycan hydrolase CwlO-like protein